MSDVTPKGIGLYHHEQFMGRAIQLARQGLYSTMPNPRVGCVLVKDGVIIGEGWHVRAGEGHAEVNALAQAGVAARGATAYVTLEPCSHYGRTPPCAKALIEAGIRQVIVGMQDPNPLVAGRGNALLVDAGIDVISGVCEQACRDLNPGFIKRMQHGLPWVTVKLAMSVDGRTAMASGESQWITGPQARRAVQRLRARSCAIVSGVEGVAMDDAALTVRAEELGLVDADSLCRRQPLRVVVDSRLRLPATARILKQPGRTVIACIERTEQASILEAAGAEVVVMPAEAGRVDLQALLRWLAQQHCNEVLVESGATLAGQFVDAGLVDELKLFMAPLLLGSTARPLVELPLSYMAENKPLHITDIRAVGQDWLISARLSS